MTNKAVTYAIYKANLMGSRKSLVRGGFLTRAEAEDHASENLPPGHYLISGIDARGKLIFEDNAQYKITQEGTLLVFSGHKFWPPKLSRERGWSPYQ